MKRRKMSKKYSKRNFKNGAKRTHKFNLQTTPLRGGGRL